MRRSRYGRSTELLSHFAGDYLGYLHESHPTEAAFDGVHLHDDVLEDYSRESIETQAQDLGGWARRLDSIDAFALTPAERVEHRMLADSIGARVFELEELRPWQRDPLHYAETLASSVAAQVLFAHAPIAERARHVVSKLRQAPRFLEAARKNVTDPPGLFAKVGIETFEGVLKFFERDLPRAFRNLDDMHLLGDLADASTIALDALRDYIGYLRESVTPRSRSSFRLGAERFGQMLRLTEGIDVPAERLLKVAVRELQATREEFDKVAGRLGDDPVKVWNDVKARHPSAGELFGVVDGHLQELVTFIRRSRLITVLDYEPVRVAPTPAFYRWTMASMWSPGVFESKALPAYYYITNVDSSWSADRQEEYLRDFNYATLPSISIHEAFPGHFLHFQHLRQLEAPLRKSAFFMPVSFVEGWAHYTEQLMFDEGFEKGNTEAKLGQLAEALLRLVRTVVGIRLHTEDLSVEQGVRLFRDEALLEERTARREAERGTFDPQYVLYALGKRMLLKLREDCRAKDGDRFSLLRFHDQLLGQGALPFWAHRELMLGESGALFD
jgi:uncharacterized protein (DUF885 family)